MVEPGGPPPDDQCGAGWEFHAMNEPAETEPRVIAWLYLIAALLSLIGLADAIYLTVEHLTGQSLRCTIISVFSKVLSSPYSHIGNLPLAPLGAITYFTD